MAATAVIQPTPRASLSSSRPPPLQSPLSSPESTATLASLTASPSSLPTASPPSPNPLSPPLPPHLKSLADRLHKRTKLIAEIHDTERHYSSSLTRVVTDYLLPLRLHSTDYGLKTDSLSLIFSNLEQLASFHAVLYVEMAKAMDVKGVCGCFMRFVDFLRMYIPYVNGYGEAMKALQGLQENKKWVKFATEKKQQMGLDLMSYLIMPVQRIPRYELLLKELKRNLDPSDTDKPTEEAVLLDETLAKIVSVAQKVNEAKREAERVSSLLAISQRVVHLDWAFPLSEGGVNADHRRVIKEGTLFKKTTFGKKARNVYLFNDHFLWCSSFKYKGHVNTLSLKVQVIEEKEEGGNDFPLELSHPDCKTFVLSAESAYDRQLWLTAFTEAAEEAQGLDPQVMKKGAERHDRSLSVSTSRLTVVGDANSPVSPASPHPHRVEEGEEDPVSWESNALKESEEEKEFIPTPHLPLHPRVQPSHSRNSSRDIKPTVHSKPEAGGKGRKGHSRNVSVVITSAGHSRQGSRVISSLTLNTTSPPLSIPSTPSAVSPIPPSTPTPRVSLLSGLSRNDITGLKRMKSPPLPVKWALESLAIILDLPLIPPPQAAHRVTQAELYWLALQGEMVKPTFLKALMDTEGKVMSEEQVKRLKGYVGRAELTVEGVVSCSSVAGILWKWVRGRYEEATGEVLEGGNEGVKEVKAEKKAVTAKVDSGITTKAESRRGSTHRTTSRPASTATTPAHSRTTSVLGPHAGVQVAKTRISPAVASPHRPPPLSRQSSLKEVNPPRTPKLSKARPRLTFTVLDEGVLGRVFSYLSTGEWCHPRWGVVGLNRRCMRVVVVGLEGAVREVMEGLKERRGILMRGLKGIDPEVYKEWMSRIGGARGELYGALSGVTGGVVKGVKALVKPPASVVPVFELVLMLMEGKEGLEAGGKGGGVGGKAKGGKDRGGKDMGLIAHKAVVTHSRLLPLLSSLTPLTVHSVLDPASTARLLSVGKGVDAAGVGKSLPMAGPFAEWVVAVVKVVDWWGRVGWGKVAAAVELEEVEWKLKAAQVQGMGSGNEWEGVKDEGVRRYLLTLATAKALRIR